MSVTISNNLNNPNNSFNDYSSRGALASGNAGGEAAFVSNNTSLHNFKSGSTLQGEVISKDNNQITLKLANNQTVSAKMDGNADVSVGQKLTFEVSRNASNQTLLRPLFANLTNDATVSMALKAAALPINDSMVSMTSQMMKEGMPINTSALNEMARLVALNDKADPAVIVQMTKIDLPLTQNNITQFENYKNFEHQVINDIDTLGEGVGELLKEAVLNDFSEGNTFVMTKEILSLIDTQQLDIILPSTLEEDVVIDKNSIQIPGNNDGNAAGAVLDNTSEQPVILSGQDALMENVSNTFTNIGSFFKGFVNDLWNSDAENKSDNAVLNAENEIDPNKLNTIGNNEAEQLNIVSESETLREDDSSFAVNNNLSLEVNEQQSLYKELNDLVKSLDLPQSISTPINAEEIFNTLKTVLSNFEKMQNNVNLQGGSSVENIISNNGSVVNDSDKIELAQQEPDDEKPNPDVIKDKIKNFLSSDSFGKLVKDSIKAQMTLKPEDVANVKNIENLYERILKQTDKINNLINSMGSDMPELAKASGNLTDNVNFMNQLNEYLNYVQLPLKMAGEDAHGELFVYTKRKALADNDGNFSALLHLDMEHLGPMDIYVAMKNYSNVSTNFMLQDEKMLDFIDEHIGELTDRLREKGYNTTMNVSKKDSGTNIPITDEFAKDEKGTVSSVVSKVCFDVRA